MLIKNDKLNVNSVVQFNHITALKSSPSKKGRASLPVPKYVGPGQAFSASQIPTEDDEKRCDLRGARSFPTLEDDGNHVHISLFFQHSEHSFISPRILIVEKIKPFSLMHLCFSLGCTSLFWYKEHQNILTKVPNEEYRIQVRASHDINMFDASIQNV